MDEIVGTYATGIQYMCIYNTIDIIKDVASLLLEIKVLNNTIYAFKITGLKKCINIKFSRIIIVESSEFPLHLFFHSLVLCEILLT